MDQFNRPYNGVSNAPAYTEINKSVKTNIKCTVLLLMPKETNIFLTFSFYSKVEYILQCKQTSELGVIEHCGKNL